MNTAPQLFSFDPPEAFKGANSQGLSYITDDEVEQAKRLVDEQFVKLTGKPFGFRTGGYYIATKIYVRPEELKRITRADGTQVTLWRPDVAREGDKYQSCSALVCGIGRQAFKGFDAHGNHRFPDGPECRIGDWLAIPRQQSYMLAYRGVALALIPDDMILGVIEDPEDVKPITQASLI